MPRRGAMLVEASIAAGLVAVAMIGIAQLLAVAAQQERALDRRRVATQEAANALERIGGLAWNEIRADKLSEVKLTPSALSRLPAGQLKCDLELLAGPPLGKRIASEVSWRNRAGEIERVRLFAWKFSAEQKP